MFGREFFRFNNVYPCHSPNLSSISTTINPKAPPNAAGINISG
jgi:hypothetical protein